MLVLFLAKHAAVLALLFLTALGAGTFAVGPREGIGLRSALGLALCGHACFFLAAIGQLRAAPLIALAVVAVVGGAWRGRKTAPLSSSVIIFAIGIVPLFVLALYPPLAFDETMYHMPFVRSLAHEGALRFLAALRFPVFPQIHELLCVPAFLLGGDVATHLVALVEVLLTAALLVDWARRRETRAGWLAAAMFLGSPLVVYLATITYVDAALTLLVAAGFYALDRKRFLLAGLFLGTACSVKYLGGYFAVTALIIILASAQNRLRAAAVFAAACAAAALPTTVWIMLNTGNPLFPFFSKGIYTLLTPQFSISERSIRIVRTVWDVTFARGRVGLEPPITPWLIAIIVVVMAASVRDWRSRWILFFGSVYIAATSFQVLDSRYFVPLLPLVCGVAAVSIAARWPRAVTLITWLAIAPGIFYAGYRIYLLGLPPATPQARSTFLAKRVPAYRALALAGNERGYVCGGEQLHDYAGGELLGDHTGPFSYERVIGGTNSNTAALAQRMKGIGARYYLVVKSVCPPLRATGRMTLAYEDAAAQLWRVQP
ncbi:MAG: hypothetical protein QOK37_3214 [Thermoanaerobaculia bacterium]|jgi:hypothetical protein|nr:hypothetical protein [Thermoanaerobaculia bacterium]